VNQIRTAKEIAKLKIPVLINKGMTNTEVRVEDVMHLAKSFPAAKLKVNDGMNHIMKDAPVDRKMNLLTYTQTELIQ